MLVTTLQAPDLSDGGTTKSLFATYSIDEVNGSLTPVDATDVDFGGVNASTNQLDPITFEMNGSLWVMTTASNSFGSAAFQEINPDGTIGTATVNNDPNSTGGYANWNEGEAISLTDGTAIVAHTAPTTTTQTDIDLLLSPAHRVLVAGWQVELLSGQSVALIPASILLSDQTVTIKRTDTVEYFHIMFDEHEIIYANGATCESLHFGPCTRRVMSPGQQREIHEIFPELAAPRLCAPPIARTVLKHHESAVLAALFN